MDFIKNLQNDGIVSSSLCSAREYNNSLSDDSFISFIDYCIDKQLLNTMNKDIVLKHEYINEAISYVKFFISGTTLNIVNKDDRYQAIAHIYAAGVYVADHVLQGHSMKAISLSLRMTDSLYLINVDSRIDIVSISNMSSAIDELLTSWIDSVEGNKIIYRITNALVSAFLLGVMTYI